MNLWQKLKGKFTLTPASAMDKFEDTADRLRRMLNDSDGDGMPDKLASIMHQVVTGVQLLELAMPSSTGVRRGGERLAKFQAQLFTAQTKWLIVWPMIEATIAAINAKRSQ